jgi:hypothetical protein
VSLMGHPEVGTEGPIGATGNGIYPDIVEWPVLGDEAVRGAPSIRSRNHNSNEASARFADSPVTDARVRRLRLTLNGECWKRWGST